MTIDTIMKDLGFNDINILCERNINFVEFSATPNNVLKDLK